MSERLQDKVIIVTGAGSGIGRAAAELFAAEGAHVAAFDINGEALDALHADNKTITTHIVDVTQPDPVRDSIIAVHRAHGRIDGVFNVAGGSGRRAGDGPAHDATLEGWNYTLNLNLTSIFLMCKYVLEPMLAQSSGAIVNVASVLGMTGNADFATHAYAASKGGVISFSRALAVYYAPHSIRVNVIAPGLIATAMSARAQQDEHTLAQLPRLQPLTGTLGQPDDCAAAAAYLLSDEAKFVTGVVLPIDGGWTAQ